MALSSWTVLNSVSVQTLMEGEATLIVAVGKSCREKAQEASGHSSGIISDWVPFSGDA